MIENQIGKRFAEALSDSISESSQLNAALESLTNIGEAFSLDPNLYRFFIHPSFPDEKKEAMVGEMCDRTKAPDQVRKLMALLVQRQKMPFVKHIATYFQGFVDQRLGQVRVKVISASPLGQAELDKLKTSLDRQLGKTAILETSVDEGLIGGIRLLVGSRVVDATIKNRLEQLKRVIRNEEALSELAS
ncbi:MAG: ATP synthase F1 subunit delta [Candidatus Nitronauta litoralis]|uniref:ATP synthase subunit delta n=1 Tax=Candidatus Nitronauta litoralis TaxID=2705533 RepID=A0A7T0BY25_9BACT|nr:MAG: ATP synthase F1 subunit delta [Candidatus Nitronauta litoralis]